MAARDVFGKLLGVLRSYELVILRRANIDESSDRPLGGQDRGIDIGGWVEGGIVDRIAVNLSDIKILLYLGDTVRLDAVSDAPCFVWRRVMVIRQLFPVRPFDQGNNTAWGFRCTTVILTGKATDCQ